MKGKEKFKNNVMTVVTGTQISMSEMKEGIMNPTKRTKIIVATALTFLMVAFMMTMAFAAEPTVWAGIRKALDDVYKGIFGLSTAIFVVCAIVVLVFAQITTNQQKTMKWLDFVKKAALIWIIIISLSLITKFVTDTFGTGDDSLDKLAPKNN